MELRQDILSLLKKVEIIDYKYAPLREEKAFNIFRILRSGSEEVELHSKFIAELLSPNGSHGMSATFLELFVKTIDHAPELPPGKLSGATVTAEKWIGPVSADGAHGGRIDIVIELPGMQPIVIENKVYANDQDKQLLRYHNAYPDAQIYYLTLDEHPPAQSTLGSLKQEKIRCLSYKLDIYSWLDSCIDRSSRNPILRETLVQYQTLVGELTGNTTMNEEQKEILALMKEPVNANMAALIVKNWVHVRWQTEKDYWVALEERIRQAGYTPSDERKYSDDALNRTIHRSRNRELWYGIKFSFGTWEGDMLNLFIERGDQRCCYGIVEHLPARYDHIQATTKGFMIDPMSSKGWPCYEPLVPYINFENFERDQATVDLCVPAKRVEIVDAHWAQISEFIRKTRETLGIVPE